MQSNVVDFPIRDTDAPSKSAKKRQADHERTGKEASERLRSPRKRLTWQDRTFIAMRLHEKIVASGIKPGRLAEAARLANGAKELHKMRLPEGKDPVNAQLLAYPNRYYDVIKALAKLTAQNFHLLVDHITVGTTVHPTRVENLNEIEKTFRALELLTDTVDRELGLFEQFRETLLLKCEAFARIDLENWPNYCLWEEDIPCEPVLADPGLWKEMLEGKYAFWADGNDTYSGGPNFDSLAYLPHAYLGIIADWDYFGIKDNLTAIHASRQEQIHGYDRIPQVGFSKETGLPIMSNIDASVYDYGHAWVILYPDQKMATVIPVLLTTDSMIGPIAERLTVSKLIELKKVERIGDRPVSAYDCLLQLVGEQTADDSGFALAKAWIETGRNFSRNPFLREAAKKAELRANRDKLFVEEGSDEDT